MMTVYIVSCALNDVSHDYGPFWQALAKAGAARAMDAVWLIESSATLDELTRSILRFLTPHDCLLIGELGKWSATHILDDAAVWLKTHKP